jgi:hypothetical protein
MWTRCTGETPPLPPPMGTRRAYTLSAQGIVLILCHYATCDTCRVNGTRACAHTVRFMRKHMHVYFFVVICMCAHTACITILYLLTNPCAHYCLRLVCASCVADAGAPCARGTPKLKLEPPPTLSQVRRNSIAMKSVDFVACYCVCIGTQ